MIGISRRTGVVLALASVAGLAVFFWPLLITPSGDQAGAPVIFLVIMPILSFAEKTKPIPVSIADAVLAKSKPMPAE